MRTAGPAGAPRAALELAQEAGLPDARLADHGDEVRGALAHDALVEAVERGKLAARPTSGDSLAGDTRRTEWSAIRPDRLPCRHALGLALQVQRLERRVLDGRVGPRMVRSPTVTLPGRAGALKPRRDVHRVAHDGVASPTAPASTSPVLIPTRSAKWAPSGGRRSPRPWRPASRARRAPRVPRRPRAPPARRRSPSRCRRCTYPPCRRSARPPVRGAAARGRRAT